MITDSTSVTEHFAIAIDGPAASGKSTLSRLLAQRLGLVMVNSGAMFRAITWKALREGISPSDTAAVINLLGRMTIDCSYAGFTSTIAIDGVDPGDELRGEDINANVSTISAIPEVRESLIALQRGYLSHSSIVMEGRDIGSVIFPDTPYKIYVKADESVRASRRVNMGEVDSIAKRDAQDCGRATAPLVVAEGAAILDNSHLGIEESVDAAIEILKNKAL